MAAARHQRKSNKYYPYTLGPSTSQPTTHYHAGGSSGGQWNYSSTMTAKNTEAAEARQRCPDLKLSGQKGHLAPPFMAKPMPFIVTTKDGKLKVNEEMEDILIQAVEPISVIAIVGKYRTGKSYVMNRFFNENAGFSLGATTQAKTKGIWLWARPHPLDASRTLVLLDTEGLLDVEKPDKKHDLQIFSLAVLLSKCFVYNAVGILDDAIIQQLNLATELTEHIKTRGAKDDENEFKRYFPSFFLLLRDFFLDIELEGKKCTSDEYLENALKLQFGCSKAVNAHNAPRQCIRNYFPDRSCFTLCKPVHNDDMLTMLDKIDEKDIRPKFLQGAKAATDAILQKAKPMAVEGNTLNGMRFLYLAKLYVKSINDGAVPCISNAVDLLKANECQKYLEKAGGVFHKLMRENLDGQLPVENDTLLKYQQNAHREAIKCYDEGALFDKQGQYRQKLVSQLEESYQSYIMENNSASRKKCEEALQSCFSDMTTKVERGEYFGKRGAHESYKKDKQDAMRAYHNTPRKGPLAAECLNEFLKSKKGEEDSIETGDKALAEKDKEIVKEQEAKCRQEQKAREEKSRNEQLQEELDRKEKEQAAMILQAQQQRRRRKRKKDCVIQ